MEMLRTRHWKCVRRTNNAGSTLARCIRVIIHIIIKYWQLYTIMANYTNVAVTICWFVVRFGYEEGGGKEL